MGGAGVGAIGRMGRMAGRLAVVGTALLGLGGFVLSFTALRDLAVRVGMPEDLAWIWPLLIDGLIIEATLAVVRLSQLRSRATWYAWALLAGGALTSVGSNSVHAVATGHGLAGAAASAVAPVVLLAMTHLTVLLLEPPTTRTGSNAQADARDGTRPGSAPAPAPPSAPAPEPPATEVATDPVTGSESTAVPAAGAGDEPASEHAGVTTWEDLETWVRAQEAAGATVTGAQVARRMGCSPSTGRRRLAAIRKHSQPHLRLAGND